MNKVVIENEENDLDQIIEETKQEIIDYLQSKLPNYSEKDYLKLILEIMEMKDDIDTTEDSKFKSYQVIKAYQEKIGYEEEKLAITSVRELVHKIKGKLSIFFLTYISCYELSSLIFTPDSLLFQNLLLLTEIAIFCLVEEIYLGSKKRRDKKIKLLEQYRKIITENEQFIEYFNKLLLLLKEKYQSQLDKLQEIEPDTITEEQLMQIIQEALMSNNNLKSIVLTRKYTINPNTNQIEKEVE